MDIYKFGIRPLLFSGLNADPEWIHHQTIRFLGWLDYSQRYSSNAWLNHQLHQAYCFEHQSLEQTLWGLPFRNPLGLAAGFDKDGIAAGMWSDFGFGFAELGTVTWHAQPGNPKPRLFRLPLDQAALNRMGFNNQGAARLAQRFEQRWQAAGNTSTTEPSDPTSNTSLNPSALQYPIPLGINLGKSKITPLESAAEDYLNSFKALEPWGNYFVVNVSSPNTPGLRSLQATEQLAPILSALQQANQNHKPILVKIAPDLEWEAIAAVIELAQTYQLAGVIATNTTIARHGLKTEKIKATGRSVHDEAGGISGAPLRQRSTEVIRFIYQHTRGTLPIIGVGGIFTAEHAWEKITAGASLVQVYTGWIYEGPGMVRRILDGLVQRLEARGLSHISEAVGLESEV